MLVGGNRTVKLKKLNLGSYFRQSKPEKLRKAAWRKRNNIRVKQPGDYKRKTQVKTGQRKSSRGDRIQQASDVVS